MFCLICIDIRESRLEELNSSQLDKLLSVGDRGHVAVLWYSRSNCRRCQTVMEELDSIGDDAAKFGVTLVKVNDNRRAKAVGVRRFPALAFYRRGHDVEIFDGDLHDEDEVMILIRDTFALCNNSLLLLLCSLYDFPLLPRCLSF